MLTQEDVTIRFTYRDGFLYWRKSWIRDHPTGPRNEPAGCIQDARGYRLISIKRKTYYAHRLIFLLKHGSMPKCIDHIDRNPLNNNIKNLRAATSVQNSGNAKRCQNNSTGFKGVSYRRGRWRMTIKFGDILLDNLFRSAEDAARAYDRAALEFYGEFANTNFPRKDYKNVYSSRNEAV